MADLNSTTHEEVVLEGTIDAVRVLKLKHGKPCAFVALECADGPAELFIYPGPYQTHAAAIKSGEKIKVSAVADCNEKGEMKYLVVEVLTQE